MIIMGYGRSGELIAQLLSENLIPFVAVDSSTNQVSKGKVSNASSYHYRRVSVNRRH